MLFDGSDSKVFLETKQAAYIIMPISNFNYYDFKNLQGHLENPWDRSLKIQLTGWCYLFNWLYLIRTPQIVRTPLTLNQILYKVVVNEKSDGGLSIDWLNEKIYWSSFETVSVGELDGSVHTTLLQKEGFDFR